MKFLRKTTWQAIYEDWRASETKNDLWRQHYERRGFETWEDFRNQHIEKENLSTLDWELYELGPAEIPAFHCGDFTNWKKLAEELGDDTFADLSRAKFFQDHQKIQNLLVDFPAKIQMIALKKGEDIYLFEGHHRAVAICQLLKAKKMPSSKLTLALAKL